MKTARIIIILFLAICLPFAADSTEDRTIKRNKPTERRTALVIGNSAYKDSPLKNPVNDARDMAKVLEELGFTVIHKENAGLRDMEMAVSDFEKQLRQGGAGLFYYAGHGIQVKGNNYLIPTDAEIETESDAKYKAMDAGQVLGKMEDAGNGLNIVILDACRNNPFGRSFRSAQQGLAQMDAPAGSVVIFATGPNSVAADGTGRNGTFTKHLLTHIRKPGLKIEEVVKSVRRGVAQDTGNKQIPWEHSSLMGDFYFASSGAVVYEQPVKQPASATEPAPAPVQKPSEEGFTNSIGMKFVYIPPGTFMMGSPPSEPGRYDNETQHKVTISRSFYMQTTEVTQGQWQTLMGSNPSLFKDCGDNCPVEKVSWDDAQAFIRKLNEKEGTGRYRLPTEAEWEYAARAGTTTPFAFGNCLSASQANYNGNYPLEGCSEGTYRDKMVSVGSFLPNAWNLYDMHGNVREWVQDWYGDYSSGAVEDPMGPGNGSTRVVRGCGLGHKAQICRSAYRYRNHPLKQLSDIGLRLVASSD